MTAAERMELRAAVSRIVRSGDGMTVEEVAEKAGVSEHMARLALGQLCRFGEIRMVYVKGDGL